MTIGFIPVRGGSKGIPDKNIKSFCGRPLVFWTIQMLHQSAHVDRIVVATDSDKISEIVRNFEFPKVEIYRRLAENATDEASTESVILEYLARIELDATDRFILAQATSPLTQTEDLEGVIKMVSDSTYDSVLTCVRQKRFIWTEEGTPVNYDPFRRPLRQSFPGILVENGALYLSTVGAIKESNNRISGKIGVYEMPEYTFIELDEEDDWLICEGLMHKHNLSGSSTSSQQAEVKLFCTDVDGVLTDAGMYYSENGDELKKFNTHDGMGLSLLRQQGIKTAIITSENTALVERRAKKLKVDYLYQGKRDGGKLACVQEICKELNISLAEVAYIGDDLNCIDLLSQVGTAACPNNAVRQVKMVPGIIQLEKKGGEGVVREFIGYLIENKFNIRS